MESDEKLARQRLTVLELAGALSKVNAACRQRGMDGSQFHEWKGGFQTTGWRG